MDTRPVRVLSLFSGVSGLGLGVRIALPESRHICFVEREFAACEVLAARMADGSLDPAPIFTDITQFDGKPWRGRVDLIEGGFPCQDLSVAGKRAGITGSRSGLWGEYVRLIEESQPEAAFIENVGGLLSSRTLLHRSDILGHFDAIRSAAQTPQERWHAEAHIERLHRRLLKTQGISALLYVQCCLGALGYESEAGFFTASEVGASHKRERVFVLAHRTGGRFRDIWRDAERGLAESEHEGPSCGRSAPAPSSAAGGAGGPVNRVADTQCPKWRPDDQHDNNQGGRQQAPSGSGGDSSVVANYHDKRRRGGDNNAEAGPGIWRGQYPSGSEPLADAGDGLISEPWRGPSGRDGAGPRSAALGDADDAGLEGRQQRGRGLRDERAAGTSGDPELADTDSMATGGVAGIIRGAADSAKGEGDQRERDGRAAGHDGDLPLFAPGPRASDFWQDLLVRHPELRPAISQAEIERLVCNLDDELAAVLAGSRTDQLRAAGNGVVSLQAAFAFVTLARQICKQ